MPQTRGVNKFKYRYYVSGMLGGTSIDRKYCSLNEFLAHVSSIEDVKPLNLSRSKLNRILSGFYENKRENITSRELRSKWKLRFIKINEPRPFRCRFLKTLVDE